MTTTECIDPISGLRLALYPDVPRLFQLLSERNIPICIASSSFTSHIAHQLLRKFELAPMIAHAVVRPGRKQPHLRDISRKLSVQLQDVLFFDDLPHNIQDASDLGCTAIRVRGGMNFERLRFGLERIAERRRGSKLMASWLKGCGKGGEDKCMMGPRSTVEVAPPEVRESQMQPSPVSDQKSVHSRKRDRED